MRGWQGALHAAEGAADRNERACEAAFIARATSAVWMAVVRREVEREPNEGREKNPPAMAAALR